MNVKGTKNYSDQILRHELRCNCRRQVVILCWTSFTPRKHKWWPRWKTWTIWRGWKGEIHYCYLSYHYDCY